MSDARPTAPAARGVVPVRPRAHRPRARARPLSAPAARQGGRAGMIARPSTLSDLALQRGERVLFRGFTLDVVAGEAVALVGDNGAGKTSLLRAVAGFIRPLAAPDRLRGRRGPLPADDARRAGCHLVGHQDGLKPGAGPGTSWSSRPRWCGGDAAPAPWPRRSGWA